MAVTSSGAMEFPANQNIRTRRSTLATVACIALPLVLFAATALAQTPGPCTSGSAYCLFVSDFGNSQVQLWQDSGANGVHSFLTGYPFGGGGGGEGMSCLTGSGNAMYTAANSSTVNVFALAGNHATYQGQFSLGGLIASLDPNAAGTMLYVGDYGAGNIYALTPLIPPAAPWFSISGQVSAPVNSHDAAVGLNGNIYGSYFQHGNTGVNVYDPTLTVTFPEFLPGIPSNPCAVFSGVQHCWSNVGGMAFDLAGNLWISGDVSGDNGVFEFDPHGNPLNFTAQLPSGSDSLPIGLTVAPANSVNAGDVIVANVFAGSVTKINPPSCTGTVASPGTCTMSAYITAANFNGKPKYPFYYTSCPNPDNDGYIEICKLSDPIRRVSGTFDFTVTGPFFNSGLIQVPVGECSGAVKVPTGTLTVTEAPAIGAQTSLISAYGYNQNGYKVNRLVTSDPADQIATLTVVPGGVNLETVALFTNFAPPPGTLKVCKIAGAGVAVGTPFTFDITGLSPVQIEAGPADQGGYCKVVGSFPYNSPITVSEVVPPGVSVSNITVTPANRGSNQTDHSVVATIGTGITEVDFTDISVPLGSCQASASLSVLLLNGNNVIAYVPKGSWSSTAPNVAVANVQGNAVPPGGFLIKTGTDPINSCASDPVLQQTVCTANSNAVYLISGVNSPTVTVMHSGGTGTIGFSGGDCTNCGIAIDAIHHDAVIGLSDAGTAAFQFLQLTPSPTFGALFDRRNGEISEDPLIDPLNSPPLLLSAAEDNNYEIADIHNLASPVFYENQLNPPADFDSSGEDCTTGIALAPTEAQQTILYIGDLHQSTFSSGTWTSVYQYQTLTETPIHNGGLAVAQGTHTGVVAQEFGGGNEQITAIKLPSVSGPGTGTPAVQDWLTCGIPNFSPGGDPHTVTAYQAPAGGVFPAGDAIAVLSNSDASQLAAVDLNRMLNPLFVARTSGSGLGHACSSGSLPTSGPKTTAILINLP